MPLHPVGAAGICPARQEEPPAVAILPKLMQQVLRAAAVRVCNIHQPLRLQQAAQSRPIPIGMGIPALCVGDDGVNVYAHNAAKERFPVKGTWQMPQMSLLMLLSAAGVTGVQASVLE